MLKLYLNLFCSNSKWHIIITAYRNIFDLFKLGTLKALDMNQKDLIEWGLQRFLIKYFGENEQKLRYQQGSASRILGQPATENVLKTNVFAATATKMKIRRKRKKWLALGDGQTFWKISPLKIWNKCFFINLSSSIQYHWKCK